jgi:hypothetical protein
MGRLEISAPCYRLKATEEHMMSCISGLILRAKFGVSRRGVHHAFNRGEKGAWKLRSIALGSFSLIGSHVSDMVRVSKPK